MISIENPWLNLERSGPPYILKGDLEFVRLYNKSMRPVHQIKENSIPEPFIGNPKRATLVLLGLNPGHDKWDEVDHRRDEIKAAIFDNLRNQYESQEYPFYARNPLFKGTGVQKYWTEYTHKLREDAGLDDREFSERLLVIEWFPYHSERCGLGCEPVCESQKYNFQLASEMLKKGVEVLGLRSKAHWVRADPKFDRVPFLKNRQRPWVTRGNMEEDLYKRIVKALKGNG